MRRLSKSDGGFCGIETLEPRQMFNVAITPTSVTSPEKVKKTFVFATFTTTDPAPLKVSKYKATIAFGDGSHASAKVKQTGSTFSVVAGRNYKKQGFYTYTVIVKDKVDKSVTSATGTAVVTSPTGAPYTDLTTNESSIFNNTYGGTFSKSGLNYTNGTVTATRVADDQDEIWSTGFDSARVVASLSNVEEGFGYFPGASGGSYTLLFPVVGKNFAVSGSTGAVAGPVRLALGSQNVAFSSNTIENPDGRDHLITYQITGAAGQSPSQKTYLLFWEDTLSSVSDFDYNDMVVELTTSAT